MSEDKIIWDDGPIILSCKDNISNNNDDVPLGLSYAEEAGNVSDNNKYVDIDIDIDMKKKDANNDNTSKVEFTLISATGDKNSKTIGMDVDNINGNVMSEAPSLEGACISEV